MAIQIAIPMNTTVKGLVPTSEETEDGAKKLKEKILEMLQELIKKEGLNVKNSHVGNDINPAIGVSLCNCIFDICLSDKLSEESIIDKLKGKVFFGENTPSDRGDPPKEIRVHKIQIYNPDNEQSILGSKKENEKENENKNDDNLPNTESKAVGKKSKNIEETTLIQFSIPYFILDKYINNNILDEIKILLEESGYSVVDFCPGEDWISSKNNQFKSFLFKVNSNGKIYKDIETELKTKRTKGGIEVQTICEYKAKEQNVIINFKKEKISDEEKIKIISKKYEKYGGLIKQDVKIERRENEYLVKCKDIFEANKIIKGINANEDNLTAELPNPLHLLGLEEFYKQKNYKEVTENLKTFALSIFNYLENLP